MPDPKRRNMISVYDAAILDRKDQAERGSSRMSHKELCEIRDQYLSPVFKVSKWRENLHGSWHK